MRHTWIYLIERKSEVFDCFWELKGFVETEMGRKIKCLQLDGRKEYFSGQFNGYLQQMGIRREFSCRYTPEQNGVAESKIWSVVEAAREMLEEKSLPKFYWAEAVRTAVHPELDWRQSVCTRAIFRNKVEHATLESVR